VAERINRFYIAKSYNWAKSSGKTGVFYWLDAIFLGKPVSREPLKKLFFGSILNQKSASSEVPHSL